MIFRNIEIANDSRKESIQNICCFSVSFNDFIFFNQGYFYEIEIYLRKIAAMFFRMFSCLWFSFHLNYRIKFSYFFLIMRNTSFVDWNTFFCFHQICFSKYFSEVVFCDFLSFESSLFMNSI